MFDKYPDTILICHDDYHAKHIGKTSDDRQFFLTEAFIPRTDNDPGCEFIALYYFDLSGKYIDSIIKNLGPREDLDGEKAEEMFDSLLNSIPNPVFTDIKIAPFKIVHDGIEFGLFPYEDSDDEDEDEDEDDEYLSLQVQPGDFMSFYEPWEGDYDT